MVYFSDMYASQILGQLVVDRTEAKIGRVKDIVLDASEQFPKVVGLLLDMDGSDKEKIILTSELITMLITRPIAAGRCLFLAAPIKRVLRRKRN